VQEVLLLLLLVQEVLQLQLQLQDEMMMQFKPRDGRTGRTGEIVWKDW